MKKLLVGALACVFSLSSCKTDTSAPDKEVLAEVKGKYLYINDLKKAMPEGLSQLDSVAFARVFVENWMADQLMYNVARKNIPDEDKIDEMVEEYRQQLIMSEYQRILIDEKLKKEITEDVIDEYFKAHADDLILRKDLIQGVFLKVPLGAPRHNQLRSWLALKTDNDFERVEKYAIQHASAYEYFVEKWTDFNAVATKLPTRFSNPSAFIRQNKVVEVKDTAFYYMLSIKNYAPAGSPYPQDYAREEIRNLLVSQSKVEFLQNFRKDILARALKKKDAMVYSGK